MIPLTGRHFVFCYQAGVTGLSALLRAIVQYFLGLWVGGFCDPKSWQQQQQLVVSLISVHLSATLAPIGEGLSGNVPDEEGMKHSS